MTQLLLVLYAVVAGVLGNGTQINEPYIYASEPGAPPQPTSVPGDEHRWVIPTGELFLMGDHRDNSFDSRYWGFVPDQNIVGRAFFVWMNFGNLKRIGSFN